jgi:hypothetical protein
MSTETDADASTAAEAEDHPLEKMVQPTIKFVIAFLALYAAQEIIIRVPATANADVLLPGTTAPITVGQLLHSGITVLLVGAILKFGSDVGSLLQESTETFAKLRRLAVLVSAIIALAVAYQLFRWVVDVYPILTTHYDLAFLIVGLLLGGWVVLIMYGNVDKL